MTRYLITRLLLLVPVLLGVSLITFAVMRVVPGDFALMVLGPEAAQADPVALANIRRTLGLDEPLPMQFVTWLGGVVRGDLGRSLSLKVPVSEEIVRRLPVTIELAVLATLFGILWGVPLGVAAATRRGGWDLFARGVTVLGIAVPNFFLGTILILVGGAVLRFIPTFEYASLTEDPLRNLGAMLYPTIALGLGLGATVAENARAATLETLDHEFVRVARAKGLSNHAVIWRHVLSNALIPIVTIIGLQTSFLLGGTVIIETIFALPGLGRLTMTAISLRDYTLVQGIVLFIALVVVLVNLVTDLAYAALDPRIRLSR